VPHLLWHVTLGFAVRPIYSSQYKEEELRTHSILDIYENLYGNSELGESCKSLIWSGPLKAWSGPLKAWSGPLKAWSGPLKALSGPLNFFFFKFCSTYLRSQKICVWF
jgi:hypothetical protein